MKKLLLPALLAALIVSPAFAKEKTKKHEEKPQPVAEQQADGVKHDELKDGTKIVIKGEEVFVVSETAAPDGEHELKDGTKLETKEGKIVKK